MGIVIEINPNCNSNYKMSICADFKYCPEVGFVLYFDIKFKEAQVEKNRRKKG